MGGGKKALMVFLSKWASHLPSSHREASKQPADSRYPIGELIQKQPSSSRQQQRRRQGPRQSPAAERGERGAKARGENLSGEYLKQDSLTNMSAFVTPSCSSDDFQEIPIEKRIENFEKLHENVQSQKELVFKQFHELSAKRKAYVAAKRRSHMNSNKGIY